MDDFSGHCGDGKYPLSRIVSETLNPVYDADEPPSSKAGGKPPSSHEEEDDDHGT